MPIEPETFFHVVLEHDEANDLHEAGERLILVNARSKADAKKRTGPFFEGGKLVRVDVADPLIHAGREQ